MQQMLNGYVLEIVKLVVLAIVTLIASGAKKLWNRYVNSDIKRNVARTVVRAVEQIYTDLHGNDKLHMAMQRTAAILADYGIEASDYELVSLIEAAVNEFNDTFHKSETSPDEEKPWDKPFPDEDSESYGMTD